MNCDLSIAIEAKRFSWKGAHLRDRNLMLGIMPGRNQHMVHVFWRQNGCPLSRNWQTSVGVRCR